MNALHVKESKTFLDSEFHAVDSGLQVPHSSLCQWNLDSGLQSLVGFRFPMAVFRIPKPSIPDSTFKIFWDSGNLRTTDVSPRLLPLNDVSRGGTSATQRQKFHADDVNQCLHNKSGSHRFQMHICSILRFSGSILVKCCVHLRMSSRKLKY